MGRRSGDIGIAYNFDSSDHVLPESFMPAQFAAMRVTSRWTAEKKLMLSILTVSLRDLRGKNQRIAREAQLWFESTDDYLFSFKNIANCLGLTQRDKTEILNGNVSLKRHRNRVPVRVV